MKRILGITLKGIVFIAWIAFVVMAMRALRDAGNTDLTKRALLLGLAAAGLSFLDLIKVQLFKLQLLGSAQEVARGNMAKHVSGLGEFEAVSNLIGKINTNTKTILSDTSEMSQRISTLSADLNETIRQEELATSQIAESIHNMAQGANEQLESTMQIKDNMDMILVNSQNINENSDSTLALAREMSDVVEKNTEVFGYVIDKMKSNAASNERILHRIEALQSEARKINDITNAVTEISDKTNILSLNASIEAARAGEHGKGFAVVAEEVRTLAQQSAEEAKGIKRIIDAINISIREIAEDTKRTFASIQEDIDYADQSKQSSAAMREASQRTYTAIEMIKQDSVNTFGAVSTTSSLFDAITETTRTSAALSEQVSAATQEQAASMANSLAIVKDLAEMATKAEANITGYINKIEITDKMKHNIQGAFHVLEEISRELSAGHADIRSYSDKLKTYGAKHGTLEYIGLLDRTGEMVSATHPIDKNNNMYTHRPYFMESIKGKSFQSAPYISNVTYQYCTAIAMPYKKSNGEIVGVIMADVNIES